jgi:hypothetical protein
MEDPYALTLIWFGISFVCVLPAIVGAAFGRGAFMVAAAIFSAYAFLSATPLGVLLFAWTAPPGTSYWHKLAIPIGIASVCACIAIFKERKSRSS